MKFSTDPELEAKITDIVGLSMGSPENAVVWCVDEKSQVQALEWSQPMVPVMPGLAQRRSHDYLRHGTRSLFDHSAAPHATCPTAQTASSHSPTAGHPAGGFSSALSAAGSSGSRNRV